MLFQDHILTWYEENKRDLPWRHTTNPYKILLSEVMSQQTQVSRVKEYYKRWLQTYPTIQDLANADTKTLLALWSGLGYNNRALRLRACAQELANKPFPKTREELLKLPGIGPYTAAAILAFAFNIEEPVIDTNIRRVLIHELQLPENIPPKELEKIAREAIPKGKSREWHNALMDYGAMVLTARKTNIKPLTKQSKFEGSTRQTRGKILKHLIANHSISESKAKKEFPHEKFEDIIQKMIKDDLILQEGPNLILKE